jgi:hypothetical protein
VPQIVSACRAFVAASEPRPWGLQPFRHGTLAFRAISVILQAPATTCLYCTLASLLIVWDRGSRECGGPARRQRVRVSSGQRSADSQGDRAARVTGGKHRRIGYAVVVTLGVLTASCTSIGTPTQTSPATSSASPGAASSDPLPLIEPGRLGPIKVGMRAADLEAKGLIERFHGQCSSKWRATRHLRAIGVDIEFRDGDPNDLDSIDLAEIKGIGPTVATRQGAHIGSTDSELRQLYGPELHSGEFSGESGEYSARVLFAADGALMFMMSTQVGEPPRVVGISAVRGSNMRNLRTPISDC